MATIKEIRPSKLYFISFPFSLALLALLLSGTKAQEKRTYHRYAIQALTAEDPHNWKHPLTHSEVEGWVAYVVKEADGDLHIRLCDSTPPPTAMDAKHCIVAEVIPTLTPKGYAPAADWRLKKGMHLIVRGIVRYDAENPGHHWWEVHPVEEMEVLAPTLPSEPDASEVAGH